jgi:hypothetical protein
MSPIGMHLSGMRLASAYLLWECLSRCASLTGLCLIGVHFVGMHPVGVHFVGVHLISVHVMGYPLHRRQH